jgi:hypothetical protein
VAILAPLMRRRIQEITEDGNEDQKVLGRP